MSNTDHTPVPRPALDDESPEGDPVEESSDCWRGTSKARMTPPSGGVHDLRDAAWRA